MSVSQLCMLIAMLLYLIGMVFIGIAMGRKTETVGDFFLGGRKLGPIVTAMSAEASDMSSYLLMGLPGLAYLTGLADVGWTVIGLAAGTYLNWLIVAKPLRRYSERIGAITLPMYFANRYHDKKRILALMSAFFIIVFFIPYTASGFAACGKLFASLFGADYHAAMMVSAVIIIFYTVMGGFLAASTTDLVQSVVMTIALFIMVAFGTKTAGGFSAVMENAKSLPGYFSFSATYDPVSGTSSYYGPITVASTLAWGLGYFGMPHILLRFMAIEEENKIAISRRIASVWVVIAMAIAVFIGFVGLGMTKVGAIPALAGSDSETVIVQISSLLSTYGIFPALVAGVVLSGILACTMSTSDSQLLAASSSVSNDILVEFFRVKIAQEKLLNISRVCLLIIAIIGVILAWDPNSSVFGIVSFAWAGFGASFGPAMLLSLFWKRSNGQGALAGMIAGGVMIFLWKFMVRPLGGVFNIYELLPAFLFALAVNVIVSLATPAPDDEIVKEFEEVHSH